MVPERLTGLPDYYRHLYYGKNMLCFKDGVQTIYGAFKNGEYLLEKTVNIKNGVSGLDILQLGWDTVAKFEKGAVGFILKEIEFLSEKFKSNLKIGEECGQVVTHAVDTCTFVWLVSGDTIVMAHLDKGAHKGGLAAITTFLPAGAEGVKGLCSRVDDEDDETVRDDFSNSLQETYGDNIKIYRRHEQKTESHLPYCGHFEIGMYRNGDEPDLFGDVTFEPYVKESLTKAFIFNSVNELVTAEGNYMKFPAQKTCEII